MNLREYLSNKKIDPDKLKSQEPSLYKTFAVELSQMHPNSFTAQKLFLVNKLRRKYKLVKNEAPEQKKTAPKVKPKIVPRIK